LRGCDRTRDAVDVAQPFGDANRQSGADWAAEAAAPILGMLERVPSFAKHQLAWAMPGGVSTAAA
jgi:hypothetical protein